MWDLNKAIKNRLFYSELNMDMEWDNFRCKVEFKVVFKVRFMVEYKMVISIDWFVNFILFKVNSIKDYFIIKEYSD